MAPASMPRFLIVDPIMRGSRLYLSWIAAAACKTLGDVHILTRQQARDENAIARFSGLDATWHETLPVPVDLWFGVVSAEVVKATVDAILTLHRERPFSGIYFSGIKEYYPLLYLEFLKTDLAALKDVPILFVEYDTEHLLKDQGRPLPRRIWPRLKQQWHFHRVDERKRKLNLRLARSLGRFRVGILDERVFDAGLARRNVGFRCVDLPDPGPDNLRWPIVPINLDRKEGPLRLLLVGIQTRRKGIDDIIRTIRTFQPSPDRLRFVLSGRLTPETEMYRTALRELGPVFEWNEGYFPDEVIERQYREADYIVLPYARDFQGSSGVFAYAMGYGRPCIASSHGCIGYRVRRFAVGYTYAAHDPASLHQVLDILARPGDPEYAQMRQRCLDYARNRSVKGHQSVILDLFSRA